MVLRSLALAIFEVELDCDWYERHTRVYIGLLNTKDEKALERSWSALLAQARIVQLESQLPGSDPQGLQNANENPWRKSPPSIPCAFFPTVVSVDTVT